MEYKKFVNIIRKAKPSTKTTAQLSIKVITNKEHTIQKLYTEKECRLCKQRIKKTVMVIFKKPIKLSIFQAGMLYSIFVENKKPVDYASYHECIAGKEFIDNIKGLHYHDWIIE